MSVDLQLASFMTPQMTWANAPCLATAIAWYYGPEWPEIQGRSSMPENIEIDVLTLKQKNNMEADNGEENRVHRRVQRVHFTLKRLSLLSLGMSFRQK